MNWSSRTDDLNLIRRQLARFGFVRTFFSVLGLIRSRLRLAERWRFFQRNLLFSLRNWLTQERPVTVQIASIQVRLQPRGTEAANIWSGTKRVEIMTIVREIKDGATFFDIGANCGIFSLAAAKAVPSARIYSFEPNVWTFGLLQENIRLNLLSNVTPVCTALYEWSHDARNDTGKEVGKTLGERPDSHGETAGSGITNVTSLDAFVETNGIQRVDLMRVYVEGAELQVFRGAKELLGRPEAPLILSVANRLYTKRFGYHPVETMWALQAFGYELFVLNTVTGIIRPRAPSQIYDATIVAMKRTHPAFAGIRDHQYASCLN